VRDTALLGRKRGAANFAELGHLCGWPEMGQLGPRTANLVPKYYGVNTFDETLTPAGDDLHRRDRNRVGPLSLVDSGLAATGALVTGIAAGSTAQSA